MITSELITARVHVTLEVNLIARLQGLLTKQADKKRISSCEIEYICQCFTGKKPKGASEASV